MTGKKLMGRRMWKLIKICYILHLADPHMDISKQWPKFLMRFLPPISLLLTLIITIVLLVLLIKTAYLFLKDQEDGYEDDLLCVADPLNQVTTIPYLCIFWI